MNKQPEALRLADALENLEATGWGGDCFALTEYSEKQAELAAKELRRLYEVNQELLHWMRYIQVQTHLEHIHDKASAAIAKVTGE